MGWLLLAGISAIAAGISSVFAKAGLEEDRNRERLRQE